MSPWNFGASARSANLISGGTRTAESPASVLQAYWEAAASASLPARSHMSADDEIKRLQDERRNGAGGTADESDAPEAASGFDQSLYGGADRFAGYSDVVQEEADDGEDDADEGTGGSHPATRVRAPSYPFGPAAQVPATPHRSLIA